MAGSTHSKLVVGEKCWIIVDDVNHPTGYWKGEVLNIVEHETYSSIKAKITDGRIKDGHNCIHYDKEPTVNYSVLPQGEDFDWLLRRIQNLETILQIYLKLLYKSSKNPFQWEVNNENLLS